MKLYADLPAVRTRQIVFDALAVGWTLLWVRLGVGLYRTVERLRVAGDTTESAGGDLAERMDGVARVIDGVPLVGDQLRQPFTGAAGASRSIASAGAATSDAVHSLALWLGVLLALLPILWLLTVYMPRRVRWVREATAATSMSLTAPGAVDLLAVRAATSLPLSVVAPYAGDRPALARLELRRLGLQG